MYGIKETKSQICATGFFVRSASKHSSLKKVKIWCTIVNQFEVDIWNIYSNNILYYPSLGSEM